MQLRMSPWHRWVLRLLLGRSNGVFGVLLRALYCRALRWGQKWAVLGAPNEEVCLLGKRYQQVGSAFMEDWQSRFLFTYRSGFSPLGDTDITSDQGWGCSLRVIQMLLAQAFASIIFGRDWRSKSSGDPQERELVKEFFLDTPNSILSLHNLCRMGENIVRKRPGEWYGPTTAAKVVHKVLQARPHKMLQTCLFEDGVLNPVKVQDLLAERDIPVLVLLCTKLGAEEQLDDHYIESIRQVFTLPWFQGMCSGDSATSAHFFIAASETSVYYLDPHTTRPALIDQLLDCGEWHPSATTDHGVLRLPYSLLNTSCSFGFLVKDEIELRCLIRALREPLLDRIFDIHSEHLRCNIAWEVDDEDTSLVLL
eukprot:GEMP01011136.1.p1 GENE.GEMP01011136.1~~GEMP01011136.1.p1  ORF type:complete len:366 (+),score=37.69 GEMP01011136.1:165-1262(+)